MGNEENLLGGITPAIQPNSNIPIHSPNDFGLLFFIFKLSNEL